MPIIAPNRIRRRPAASIYTERDSGPSDDELYGDVSVQQPRALLPVQVPQQQQAPAAGPQMLPMPMGPLAARANDRLQARQASQQLAQLNTGHTPQFDQSLQRDRALGANRSGQFASLRQRGESERSAAQQAYAGTQMARADMDSGNYFLNRGLATDANTRANEFSGANAGLLGSVAGYNDALAGGARQQTAGAAAMLPAQVAAAANQNNLDRQLLPVHVRGAQAAVAGQEGQNDANRQMLPIQMEAGRAGVAGAYADINRQDQMLPIVGRHSDAQAGVAQGQANLYNAQAHALQQQQPPAADPLDQAGRALDLTEKMIKAGVAPAPNLPPGEMSMTQKVARYTPPGMFLNAVAPGRFSGQPQPGSPEYQQAQRQQTFQGIMGNVQPIGTATPGSGNVQPIGTATPGSGGVQPIGTAKPGAGGLQPAGGKKKPQRFVNGQWTTNY